MAHAPTLAVGAVSCLSLGIIIRVFATMPVPQRRPPADPRVRVAAMVGKMIAEYSTSAASNADEHRRLLIRETLMQELLADPAFAVQKSMQQRPLMAQLRACKTMPAWAYSQLN